MTDISIDKDIPIPPPGRFTSYPWRNMEVGDSFLYPGTNGYMAAKVASKRTGLVFKARKTDEGTRIWRTA